MNRILTILERYAFLIARSRINPQKIRTAFTASPFGFDISKYQGATDFAKMRAYGARFLILRASYGAKRDEMFDTFAPAAANEFGGFGVYHFYDPIISPYEQATTLLNTIEPYKDKVRRVWLDLEFWWDGNYSAPQYWKILRDRVRAAGYRVGWYTRATWWDGRVGAYAADFATDPCWAAQYSTSLNLIPKGWTRAMIWQAGTPAIGYEAGVSSKEIDYNLWNDEFDFEAEWGAQPPPPTGGNMEKWIVAASGGWNLRPQPNTNNTPYFLMPKGTLIWGTMDASTGWIAVAYVQKPGEPYASVPPQPAYCSGASLYVAKQTYTDPPLAPVNTRTLQITITEDGWKPVTVEVQQERA